MATKKEKRARVAAKSALEAEQLKAEGLAAQRRDREARAQAERERKEKKSRELLDEHARKKQARKDIADARREHQEVLDGPTPGQILATWSLVGSMMNEDSTADTVPLQ